MDIRNVFILFNESEFTKDGIIKELKEEGYQHNFIFGFKLTQSNLGDYLRKCDELWCFGDCSHMNAYKVATEFGIDVWNMG